MVNRDQETCDYNVLTRSMMEEASVPKENRRGFIFVMPADKGRFLIRLKNTKCNLFLKINKTIM